MARMVSMEDRLRYIETISLTQRMLLAAGSLLRTQVGGQGLADQFFNAAMEAAKAIEKIAGTEGGGDQRDIVAVNEFRDTFQALLTAWLIWAGPLMAGEQRVAEAVAWTDMQMRYAQRSIDRYLQ